MTTLEAIYENGIFKSVSDVPQTIKEHERVRLIIETNTEEDLQAELEQWEKASDEDFARFEESLPFCDSQLMNNSNRN